MLPSLVLPLAGVLFVGGFSPSSFFWAALGIVGSVVYAVARWATFTYRIVDDRLELTRSLISRSVRTIPLARVRGVDISTPPLHRLLGLAVLRVDTGASGGGDQEGELDALTVAEAERLRDILLERAAEQQPSFAPNGEPGSANGAYGAHGGPQRLVVPQGGERGGAYAGDHPGVGQGLARDAGAGPRTHAEAGRAPAALSRRVVPPVEEQVLAKVPRAWLRYGPLSGSYLLTPFALVAGAVGVLFQVGQDFGVSERTARSVGAWLWERPYLLVAAAVALVLAMPVVGGIMYAVFHWDFTLRRRGGFLVAERGLITRRSVSLESIRIRGYEIDDGIVERRAHVIRLRAIVTGLGDSRTRGQLLPVTPRDYALRVAAEAIWPFTKPLVPHPVQARRRRLFRAIVPWPVIAVIALVLGWEVVALAALALALLSIPLGLDRYHSLGHAYDGGRLSVRSGSLRRAQAMVERRAVVGWTIRQTWFQRRSGVLTVIAGVGAGTGGYAAIDTGETQGVSFAAEITPEWIAPFQINPTPQPPDQKSPAPGQ